MMGGEREKMTSFAFNLLATFCQKALFFQLALERREAAKKKEAETGESIGPK